MKQLTKLMCYLFERKEITLGLLLQRISIITFGALFWNFLGYGYTLDFNTPITALNVFFGGFLDIVYIGMFIGTCCLIGAFLTDNIDHIFDFIIEILAKISNKFDIVIFKCKK